MTDEYRSYTINRLTDRLVSCSGAVSASAIREDTIEVKIALNSCSDSTLELISEYIAKDNSRSNLNSVSHLLLVETSETLLRECITFYPHLPLGFKRRELIEVMHRYSQFHGIDDLSTAGDDIKAQVIALLSVTVLLIDSEARDATISTIQLPSGGTASFIKGDALPELIIERPSDADMIARIAIERITNDAEVITAVLDFEESSLGSGVL